MESVNRYIGEIMIKDLEILRTDLARLPEDKLWTTYPGISNSFGNLVLHICGNLNHFIGHLIGGTSYLRDRDAEFSDKDIPADQLGLLINDTCNMLNAVTSADENFTGNDSLEIAGNNFTREQALIYLTNHLAYHIGQANYISRIIENDKL